MKIVAAVALALAALVYPVAWAIDAQAVEAWQITPFAPDVVEMNRVLDAPSPSDPDYRRKVAAMYGNVVGEPDRFLFVPADRFVYPVELPELRLLPVDKQAGDDPLQARTVWFLAPWFAGGFALAGVGPLLLGLRRKSLTPPPADDKLSA